jgi:hypothetical protein
MVATRRASPEAIGAWARGEQGNGAWLGWRGAEAGRRARWANARGRVRWRAGPASAGGPEARRRPANEKKNLFHFYFQEIFKCQL